LQLVFIGACSDQGCARDLLRWDPRCMFPRQRRGVCSFWDVGQ